MLKNRTGHGSDDCDDDDKVNELSISCSSFHEVTEIQQLIETEDGLPKSVFSYNDWVRKLVDYRRSGEMSETRDF